MTFWHKLEASIRRRDSLLCVGLDPDPAHILPRYSSVADFNRAVIEATADLVCAYKPNIAFYEALGEEGLRALRATLDSIPADIPVILDAKRNDIASTATAYARAAFEYWGVDALTVNPYLGRDGVEPFLAYPDRGVFLLCKTSNPSAPEVQDWTQGGEPLYRHIARLAEGWASGREIGLVIGATYPEAIADIRQQSPHAWFLIPGVGAQGGELQAVLRAGLRPDGMGLIINASRSVLYAADPRAAAASLRDEINATRAQVLSTACQTTADLRRMRAAKLARLLFEAGCVRFGDFVLHSGAHSPIYIDLRRLVTYPRVLAEVANAYMRLLAPLTYDRIAAIPYAALPIGTAVALQTGRPLIYPRREVKAYGTKRPIEGEYRAGERVVLLDDLITTGGSKLEALEPLLAEGLLVEDVVVLIDREQGGARDLAQKGLRLHAALTLRELVDILAEGGQLAPADAQRVRDYLAQESPRV
nr:putative orotidine decarboxylase [uncultured bacterium pG7]